MSVSLSVYSKPLQNYSVFYLTLGRVLRNIESDWKALALSMLVFMMTSAMYSFHVSLSGLLLISKEATSTLSVSDPALILVLFTASYLTFFFAFVFL